ncbi:TPA: hypothetical protein ACPJZQ_004723 [Vibrio alginolyticus]
MNESFNFAPVVTLGVFVLGILFTPLMRKWDYYLASSKTKKVLFTELTDCRDYLKDVATEHFRLLHTLETQSDANGYIQKVPVPIVNRFDLDFLKDFYKDCLLLLSIDERHLIREVPEKLSKIKDMSDSFVNDVSNDHYYNQRAARNILWASCSLYIEIGDLIRNEYKRGEIQGSIESTKLALLEFGVTEEQMETANAFKSMLSEEQRSSLSTTAGYRVP